MRANSHEIQMLQWTRAIVFPGFTLELVYDIWLERVVAERMAVMVDLSPWLYVTDFSVGLGACQQCNVKGWGRSRIVHHTDCHHHQEKKPELRTVALWKCLTCVPPQAPASLLDHNIISRRLQSRWFCFSLPSVGRHDFSISLPLFPSHQPDLLFDSHFACELGNWVSWLIAPFESRALGGVKRSGRFKYELS